jgi:anti-sigma B factor antagonist
LIPPGRPQPGFGDGLPAGPARDGAAARRDGDLPGGGHAWVRPSGGLPVICVPDEVDLSNACELVAALTAAARDSATVIVDMSRTTYCDSSGISALVQASRTASAASGSLLLVTCSPIVLRVLAVTGVDRLLQVHASVPDAIAAAPPAASPASSD